ncbi:DNA-binding transcriptional regulator SgrR of sgrS sRNA, contains a MarR-type HTH domain and a solute-binding domain [Paenibacillus sp. UNCCL117]|uniref:ABC transporter substrate-binding protein n=1 Tax=unclassified Paenibacillus TaxID=185978 RepID=UPI000880E460|nr:MULTISPECIES: ABC transporter substrate-binding protein [unclassified Paenibacillus]SDE30379.1 DNA-binding transcriptional regulator SgrR of sgrS sRNA, contains a MarR-type HTH domain and a solute-binding domain [Paenibacillus sp. cl123]SFW63091.1 DNA-binding transcriptional regulator SgrR of sgrS sRNA, contains a MarR-type HTH domain and a solute-binding domain [Paenibacillus sp. UNCCL117]
MRLSSHYMRLRQLYPYASLDQELTVTLGELADALQCTHRNAQLLMNKMRQQGWLDWEPKRGRGSRSSLIFRSPSEDIALSVAKELVEHKDLRGALEQLSLFSPDSAVKETFHRWLGGQFGYSSEVQNNKRLDTLRFPLTQQLQSLDPATIHFTTEAHLVHQLFDPLVRYNRLTQTIEPHLAHAWEVSPDRTVWTFHLRKGVLFHHGRELAAGDVTYTFERLKRLAGGALYSWVHRQVERVEAVDPITVSVRLQEPNELFLQFAGTNRASIVPADRCAELGEAFALSPVGTGPFKLSHRDDTLCILDAFAPYFQGRAHLDRVELWHIPDLQKQDYDRTLGSFQVLHNYRLPDEASDAWQQIQQKGATCRFLTFNLLKQGPLLDPGVRGLVMAALDRAKLLARIGGDAVGIADSFLAAGQVPGAESAAMPCRYGTARIRELVKSCAGYRGERLRLCTITQYEEDALHVQALLQEAGFACELQLLSAQEFKSEQRLHADLLLFSLMLDTDVELRLFDLYTSMQRHLEPSVKQAVGSLLRQVLLEPTERGRAELLQRIEGHLSAKRVLCFLYEKRLKTIYHASVKGISLDALDWVPFKNIWLRP